MADEQIYNIPLRAEWEKAPQHRRAKKAIRAIREFLVRHMKIYDKDLRKVKIGKWLNMHIWQQGIKKPPSQVKVKVTKEGEIVTAELAELPKKGIKELEKQKAEEVKKGKKPVAKPVEKEEKKEEPKLEEKVEVKKEEVKKEEVKKEETKPAEQEKKEEPKEEVKKEKVKPEEKPEKQEEKK